MFSGLGLALVAIFAFAMIIVTYGSIAIERGWAVGGWFSSPPALLLIVGWLSVLGALVASVWVGPWWRVLATIGLGFTACSIAVPLLRSLVQPLAILGLPAAIVWLLLLLSGAHPRPRAAERGDEWPEKQKEAYVTRCSQQLTVGGQPIDGARRSCQCLADSLEAEFGLTEYEAMMTAQPDPNGSDVARRLYRVVTRCLH